MPRIHPNAAYFPFVLYIRYLSCVERVEDHDGRAPGFKAFVRPPLQKGGYEQRHQ